MGIRRPIQLRLDELMAKNNETPEDLAKALGNTTEGTIIDWKNEKRDISVRGLVQLSFHYKCSVDYLLGLSPTPTLDAPINELKSRLATKDRRIEEMQDRIDTNNREISRLQNTLEVYEKHYNKLSTDENGVESFFNWILNNLKKVLLVFGVGSFIGIILSCCTMCF